MAHMIFGKNISKSKAIKKAIPNQINLLSIDYATEFLLLSQQLENITDKYLLSIIHCN